MNKLNVMRCLAVVLVIIPVFTRAQSNIKELMGSYFNDIHLQKSTSIPKEFSIAENSKTILTTLVPYLKDTLSSIRAHAYTISHLAGTNAKQTSTRSIAVTQLIEGYKDQASGNAGTALEYLTSFKKEDFSKAALDTIRNIFKTPPHFDQLLKLIGFLELKDLQEDIRPYSQPGNQKQLRWAAIISLARMGDAAATQDMMTRARKLPVNDDIIYQVFPDLVYSRQREAIDYMVEVMQSDAKNCMSADAEREAPIACGYRIMEQLAPAIEGYPLKLDASGDIETKDYAAALITVRDWFKEHKDYKILKDKY